jgi:hypothetical protein
MTRVGLPTWWPRHVLEDGVRHSAVLVALIGQHWTKPPFVDRLFTTDDWVRREILLAKNQDAIVVAVLVDRELVHQGWSD